jgi:hypothetical protein
MSEKNSAVESPKKLHQDALALADLGTHALIGDYQSEQKLKAEIRELEKNPAHLKSLATELSNIKTTSDQLPVSATFDRSSSGEVTALVFESSKELKHIVGANEAKYAECVSGRISSPNLVLTPQEACKSLDVNASPGPLSDRLTIPVTSPGQPG